MRYLMASAMISLSTGSALAAWPSDPTINLPVAVLGGEQSVEKIATMPDGTTWVGWFDSRGGSYAVYVQRLKPDGTETLAPGGLLVSNNPQSTSLVDWDLTVDTAGNCFLAFTDTREGGDLDVFAYLIDPTGAFLWGANGVQASTVGNTDFEADPRVLFANGQYLVSWPRYGTVAPGLWLQRYGPGGAPQEVPGGVRIAGNGTEVPAFQEWVATSDNQFIMMWQRDTRTFSSPRHVRAMRFSVNGTPQWNAGVPLEISNGASAPIAHKTKIIKDASDRVGYAWHDGRTGSSRGYVQCTSPTGIMQFPLGGSSVSSAAGMLDFDPAIAFVPGSSDVMAFVDERNGSQSLRGVIVQRFDAAGAPQLGANGLTLRPIDSAHEGFLRAAPSTGGATLLFMHAPNAGVGDTSNELIAMKVDTAGTPQWTTTMSTPPVTKFRLNITNDADNEIRAVWQDGRNDVSDLYAQNINADGTLGDAPPASCPGDANGDLVVDAADLSVLLSNFNQPAAGPAFGDFNGDSQCNGADLSVLLGAFGSAC